MSDVVCCICGAKAVCVKKTIINGLLNETFYCGKCRESIGSDINVARAVNDVFLGDNRGGSSKVLTCKCGLTSKDITSKGKFGCSACYTTFRDIADTYLSSRGLGCHKGKAPIRYANNAISNNDDVARNIAREGIARHNLRDNAGSAYTNKSKRRSIDKNYVEELRQEYASAVTDERYLDADTLLKKINQLECKN